jgi:hypothetical protein
MAVVYPFTENNDHEIFNYKQFANVISSEKQQNNYDRRFTQVNSFRRAVTNRVSDLIAYNAVPKIASYEGVDILLKFQLINTFFTQSIITAILYLEQNVISANLDSLLTANRHWIERIIKYVIQKIMFDGVVIIVIL